MDKQVSINEPGTMTKIKVTQVRSRIGKPEQQKQTLKALGLRRIRHAVEHEATPQILGMIARVRHLVTVEETA
jgi:large subunit ribosomal protein L30